MGYGARNFGQKVVDLSAFTVAEVGMVETLGVSRSVLKAIRGKPLVRGTDWESGHKNVMLTPAAVSFIEEESVPVV